MSYFTDLTIENVERLYGDSDILDFSEMNANERLAHIKDIYQKHKDDLDAKDILDVYEGIHEMLVSDGTKGWKSRDKASQRALNAAKRIHNRWRSKQRL